MTWYVEVLKQVRGVQGACAAKRVLVLRFV